MPREQIILWSNTQDSATDKVQRQLELLGAKDRTRRINTDEYGSGYRLSSDVQKSTIHVGSADTYLEDISAIYYRRPSFSELPLDARDLVAQESYYFARAILLQAPGASWLNHPLAVQRAENKLLQLATAVRCEMAVPRTALVASARQALDFYQSCEERCVCKPGSVGTVSTPEPLAVYTWALERGMGLEYFETVTIGPTLLQEHVRKRADIRWTQVGQDGIAVRIHSPEGTVDWRTVDGADLRYEVVPIAGAVQNQVRQLMERMELSFGAFDFAETEDGDWIFLEVNPAGQWAWLDDEAGVSISDRIASWLIEQ